MPLSNVAMRITTGRPASRIAAAATISPQITIPMQMTR